MNEHLKINLQKTIEKCKSLEIETIMLEDSNSDFTGEYESTWLIDTLIDFCIKNKVKTVYIEPIRFNYEDFCRLVDNKYSQTILESQFDKEMEFLRKEFPNINEEKMRQILDGVTERYVDYLNYKLKQLKSIDGAAIDYIYKAYSHDQCMKCDWSEVVALMDYRDEIGAYLQIYKSSLIVIMEQLAYTPM